MYDIFFFNKILLIWRIKSIIPNLGKIRKRKPHKQTQINQTHSMYHESISGKVNALRLQSTNSSKIPLLNLADWDQKDAELNRKIVQTSPANNVDV